MVKKKTEAESEPAPNANMELWNRLCRTNPAYTKKVEQRGGFTAIGAHSQILTATEAWGPVGGKWGFAFEWIADPDLWVAVVTLRYPDEKGIQCSVSQVGAAPRRFSGKPDSDAPKKAITDGLTKCFSYTGMNADVFLGKFDDNKYVDEMREEFGLHPNAAPVHPGKPGRFVPKPITKRDVDKDKIKKFCELLCGDKDWYEYFQGLGADLGMPMDADAMSDEQIEHIVAELEAMKAARDDMAGDGQGTLGIDDGPPMSAYGDGEY